MNEVTLSQIEDTFSRLSLPEQLQLIERLIHQVHDRAATRQPDLDQTLAQMAADPQIRAELARIEDEFSGAEADGLEMN